MFTKSLWPVRRFYAVARLEHDQMGHSAMCLFTFKSAKSIITTFRKSQTSIFSKMVKISLLNGKVSLFSIKLYPKVVSYHLSKNWKKTTTFAFFLKVRLTQKRTITKYTYLPTTPFFPPLSDSNKTKKFSFRRDRGREGKRRGGVMVNKPFLIFRSETNVHFASNWQGE